MDFIEFGNYFVVGSFYFFQFEGSGMVFYEYIDFLESFFIE